jgi:hypothetical protein
MVTKVHLNSTMKTAYLFLTRTNHNQPDVWSRFFSGHDGEYSLYCHPQSPESVTQPFLRDHIVSPIIPTLPGQASVVAATLVLLREAYADPANTFFVLVSESCVPIYTFPRIREAIAEAGGPILDHWVDKSTEAARRWASLAKPRIVSFHDFRKQSQWMILDRNAVGVCLQEDFVDQFNIMYAPDEHYFVNVLLRLGYPLDEIPRRPSTYVNWDERMVEQIIYTHPMYGTNIPFRQTRPKIYTALTRHDVEKARDTGALFMRKIAAECDCSFLPTDD